MGVIGEGIQLALPTHFALGLQRRRQPCGRQSTKLARQHKCDDPISSAAEVGLAGARRLEVRARVREALVNVGFGDIDVVGDAEIALYGASDGAPRLRCHCRNWLHMLRNFQLQWVKESTQLPGAQWQVTKEEALGSPGVPCALLHMPLMVVAQGLPWSAEACAHFHVTASD